jgi:hypothetical protein
MAALNAEERQRVDEMRPPETLEPVDAKDLPPLLRRRFEEKNGTVGDGVLRQVQERHLALDGHKLLRIAKSTDNVVLDDGVVVQTGQPLHHLRRDAPFDGARRTARDVRVARGGRLRRADRERASLRGGVAVLGALVSRRPLGCSASARSWT